MQSRVGSLLWAFRVRQAGAETASLLRHDWLLSLWSRLALCRKEDGPQARFQTTIDERRKLGSAEMACYSTQMSPWQQVTRRLPTRVRIVDATMEAWSYVEYSVTPTGELGPESARVWGAHNPADQLLAAANAASRACDDFSPQQQDGATLLLGLSADSVRHAIDKTYASSPELRDALRYILRSGHVWTFRVAGTDNVADADSRERTRGQRDPEITARSEARARAVLTGLWGCWHHAWDAIAPPSAPSLPSEAVVNHDADDGVEV